jgi:hypothetical protein
MSGRNWTKDRRRALIRGHGAEDRGHFTPSASVLVRRRPPPAPQMTKQQMRDEVIAMIGDLDHKPKASG